MKQVLKNIGLGAIGLQLLISCVAIMNAGAGGEGIPSLNDINSMKYELADGEAYQLAGVVTFLSDGEPYLKIDLKKQPWLASAARVQFPYYGLQAGAAFWKTYDGQYVTYMCIASGSVSGGTYQLTLKPIKASPTESLIVAQSDDLRR